VELELDLIEGVPNSEVLARLSRADVVVEKLVNEGFGVAALEAMAVGRPVVSRIAPAIYAQHPDLPIVPADPSDFADVLEGLLRDPARLGRIAARGREYVARNHDVGRTGERLEAIYRSEPLRPAPRSAGVAAPAGSRTG